jgi:hypothetical protein
MENCGYIHVHNRCPKPYLVLLRGESYPRAISGSVCECATFESSSVGGTLVSKTGSRGFESLLSCKAAALK